MREKGVRPLSGQESYASAYKRRWRRRDIVIRQMPRTAAKERYRAGVFSVSQCLRGFIFCVLPPKTCLRVLAVLCSGFVLLGVSVSAHDWPQFLGPQRNGVYSGPPLASTWPAGGPRKVWRKPVGQGFAGPVVAGDRLVLFHRVGNEEVVEALDARTGDPRWRYAYPTSYRDDFGFDEGPRAVPVVAQGRVYTFGAEGQLH